MRGAGRRQGARSAAARVKGDDRDPTGGSLDSGDPSVQLDAPPTKRITILIGADAGVRAGIGFVVGLAVARYLGPAALGTLALAVAVVTVLLPIGGLGVDSMLIQRLAEFGPRSDRSQALLRAASSVRAAGAILTLVAALGFAAFRSPEEALAVVLVAPALLSGPFESGWGWVLASGHVGGLVAVRIAVAVVAAGVRLAIIGLDGGVPALALVTGLEILLLAVAAAIVARMQGARFAPQPASRREMLRESLPILASGVFFLVMLRVDVFLIDAILGADETGQYAAVIRFAEATYLVASVAVAAAAPRIIAAHRAGSLDYLHAYRRLLRGLLGSAVVLAVILTIVAEPLVQLLLGDEYVPAAPVLALYAWTAIPVFLGTARDRLVIDLAVTRTSVVNTLFAATLNVALNLVLLSHIGLIGAGIASLVSYLAMVTVIPALDPRQRQANWVMASAVLPEHVVGNRLATARDASSRRPPVDQ